MVIAQCLLDCGVVGLAAHGRQRTDIQRSNEVRKRIASKKKKRFKNEVSLEREKLGE